MQYRYSSPDFNFSEIDKGSVPTKGEIIPKSLDLKVEHILAAITNDIYDLVYREESFPVREIEKIVITSLYNEFNKTQVSKLTGLSIRTIGNKFNEYRSVQ